MMNVKTINYRVQLTVELLYVVGCHIFTYPQVPAEIRILIGDTGCVVGLEHNAKLCKAEPGPTS